MNNPATQIRPLESTAAKHAPDTDLGSNPAIVRDKWNESHRQKEEGRPIYFAWQHPTVLNFMRERYLGKGSAMKILKDAVGKRKIRKALELGGGTGNAAFQLFSLIDIDECHVIEISDYSIDVGNKRAREKGLNVKFSLGDLNEKELPPDTYDLIMAHGSLHHIKNLEHLFAQVAIALTADGLFFANDYMGPTQMQWDERQLAIMNALLATFPDRYCRTWHKNNEVIRKVTRIPLATFAKHDPSEGVRSSEILGVMAAHLDTIALHPQGYTVLYELLRGRIHNFDPASEQDNCVLELLCAFERTLIESGVIGSDFNLVVAKKKR